MPAPATPAPARGEEPGLITFHRPAEVPAARTVRPVPGRVVADYGWVAAGEAGEHYHHGVDLAAREGDPVRALRGGTVRRVGSGDPDRREGGRDLGQFVEIDHGEGVLSRYAPLTDLQVKVGDRVEAGAVIGRVASPPPAEPGAPHLHLEVHAGGGSVDPKPFLDDGGGI
nr:MAG: hypothetical protein DIU70_10770 [Bacillota bacterium]